ncbi:Ff.00g044630.m01.CDS01 [Fusarium sp. VM40]|nr:Ff.00g044630.m01.CDS01 [Fusarium sp. VM40]
MAASDVRIETITNPEDFTGAFRASANAFGHQTKDAVWIAFNPDWDTPEGVKVGAQRMVDRFSSITKNRDGQPNTVFVKATLGDTIAGLAIWQQASVVDGFGDAPKDLNEGGLLEKLYPGNEAEQRFLAQADASLFGRRREIIKEKASASPPAVFVMDLCAVDPQFQRRGIARKLVQWGLDEAERRGNLECITEASTMGRLVYLQQGFKQEGEETVYKVDEEFRDRDLPSNIVLRTGGQ